MSSSYFNYIQLFWIAFQLVQGVLCLWIALLVFRQRNLVGWITLIAAILSPLFSLAAQLWQHLAIRNLSGGMDHYIEISQALYLGHAVSILAFMIGLLLHLQRRKLETDRISELETILHDLQQRKADSPPHPPR